MRTHQTTSRIGGLTLVECLVVLAILLILAAMLLPRLGGSRKPKVPVCMNHLKQIDLGLIMFAGDHQDRFPMQLPVTNGGTMEFIYSNHVFPHFQKLKDYHVNPQLFVCPFETDRQATTSYEAMNDLNLSYFLNADITTNSPAVSIIAGDRCLTTNSTPVPPGLFTVTSNLNLGWTPQYHASRGVFAFADGHVEFIRGDKVVAAVGRTPVSTNRFCIP